MVLLIEGGKVSASILYIRALMNKVRAGVSSMFLSIARKCAIMIDHRSRGAKKNEKQGGMSINFALSLVSFNVRTYSLSRHHVIQHI